jgi:hypothetical protein
MFKYSGKLIFILNFVRSCGINTRFRDYFVSYRSTCTPVLSDKSQRGEQYCTYNKKERRLMGLVAHCVGTAFYDMLLLMESWKRR